MTSMSPVVLNGNKLISWEAFHAECATAFGFPSFYGHNRDAWIDCLSDIGGGLMSPALQTEESFLIVIENSAAWAEVAPEMVVEFAILLTEVHSRFKDIGVAKHIAIVFR